jgi:excisionase family DNA binding protein
VPEQRDGVGSGLRERERALRDVRRVAVPLLLEGDHPAGPRQERQERAERRLEGGPAVVQRASLLLALGGADCLLTVAEVARTLRLSKATVYKLVAEEKVPHVRVGNAIRFVPSALDVKK